MMHIQDPVKHLYWSFFAKIVHNMVLNTSQEYPWCLLRSRKKCGGCIYTDTLATNILQKWSMLQNKTNEDFYLLENERKINRKVNAVLNSLKLFHDLFDVGKIKRIRITKMKRALTNTCSNKKELQSKDEV